MKRIYALFAVIILLTTVASAKEIIPICKDIPVECDTAIKAELTEVIKTAQAMGMTAIGSSKYEIR